jgi:cysteine desulfuration protein SufE
MCKFTSKSGEIVLDVTLCKESQSKQAEVIALFNRCSTTEERYQTLMTLGKTLTSPPESACTPSNEVPGCQSIMHLHSTLENGRMHFQAQSEALISAGLAAVLILAYDGLTPEAVLTCPPTFLEELQLGKSLSPNRANGLYSIHLKMKQDALRLLVQNS